MPQYYDCQGRLLPDAIVIHPGVRREEVPADPAEESNALQNPLFPASEASETTRETSDAETSSPDVSSVQNGSQAQESASSQGDADASDTLEEAIITEETKRNKSGRK